MADKLKPCPFCGAPEPRLATGGARSIIICDGCGAQVPFQLTQRAVEYWNRRADLAWLPPELEFAIREVLAYAQDGVVELDASLLREILAAVEAGRDAQ